MTDRGPKDNSIAERQAELEAWADELRRREEELRERAEDVAQREHAVSDEIELDVVDIERTDGRTERISMVMEAQSEDGRLDPLEEVEDIEPSDVELIPQPAVSGVRMRPPIVGQDEHPFRVLPAAVNATEAWNRLRSLEWWTGLEPDVERLLAVPRQTIVRAQLRILSDMIHYGLACEEVLLGHAVGVGLAPGLPQIIETLARRFSATVSAPGWGGLTADQVRANWAALRALAEGQNLFFAEQGEAE